MEDEKYVYFESSKYLFYAVRCDDTFSRYAREWGEWQRQTNMFGNISLEFNIFDFFIGGESMTKEESYAVKQELKEYKFLIQRLEKLKEDRLRIEALAEKMTSTISGMPSAHNNFKSKVEDGAIQLAEISMKYTNMLIESEKKKIEILNKISKTKEPYRNILERIYIYNDNLMEIALDYDWNYNYVCMQHMRALNNYFEKTKKVPKVE